MKKKTHDYRLDRFSIDQLQQVHFTIQKEAAVIGGLPNNHHEVYQKKGWLLPFLFAYDDLLWGRWKYWTNMIHQKTIKGSGPIPKIDFVDHVIGKAPYKMLQSCVQSYSHYHMIEKFADWLLWAFGQGDQLTIDPTLNQQFYERFDLFLLLDQPTDYFSQLLCEEAGKGYMNARGYFPTPFSVSKLITQMVFSSADSEENKIKTFHDSCVGCGALMLPASNYCLRGAAQDISLIAVKLCKIQMFLYAPWFAFPCNDLEGFEQTELIKLDLNQNQYEFHFAY